LRDVEAESELEEFLKEIEESALRCKEIVQNLLVFSRAPQQGEISAVDVNTVVERAVALVAHQFNKGNVVLETRNDARVPAVRGNANRLMQVLVNLLTNARHAMDESGGTVSVETGIGDNDMVMLKVRDDGTGIPEDVLPKIFEPFFTTKEEGKGTGLGLSLSYGIVQEHGGLFEVESVVGEGTEFRVLLPPLAS
jgi:signal transduction histidine kinase